MDNRIIIDGKLPTELIFNNPVTLRNLTGRIPPIKIICKKNSSQQFALQIIDCHELIFEDIYIEGDIPDDDKDYWIENAPDGIVDYSSSIFKNINLFKVNVGISLRSSYSKVYNLTGDIISGDLFQATKEKIIIKKVTLKRAVEVYPYHQQHRDIGQCFTDNNSELSDILIEEVVSTGEVHPWSNSENLQGILFTDCTVRNCIVNNCRILNGHPIHGITLPESYGCTITNNLTDANINVGYNNKPNDNNIIKNNVVNEVIIDHNSINNEITDNNKFLINYESKGNDDMEKLIDQYAYELGVEPLALKALIVKESSKWGAFYNNYPIILFEPTKMASELIKEGIDVVKLLESNPSLKDIISFNKVTKFGTLKDQLKKLAKARTISPTAAIAACSWGLFQIGGWQWREMKYDSPLVFEQKAATIEGQFELLSTFLTLVKPKALAALRKRDWESLKIYYNGDGKNNWAGEIAQIYRRLLAEKDPKKNIGKGDSRTVNSQVIDVAVKTTTAVTAHETSSSIIVNNNNQSSELTKVLTDQLNNLEGLKSSAEQIKDIVTETATKVTSITDSSIISSQILTYIIIGIFILSIIPNLRALYTYLDDNGYLPNKTNLNKLFKNN